MMNTKDRRNNDYDASQIEVLEGLEPVRKRPGMYIGGVDENSLHHLVNEIFDNAMDEAVAGHASKIEIYLDKDNVITISDNGRGIPIDNHPKFNNKSALEVILTTLHSGGKFSNDSYKTAGGLHGVGISVVNALSDDFSVSVKRNKKIWKQTYSKGIAKTKLLSEDIGDNASGTIISFHPDPEIFGDHIGFKPKRLYDFAKAKAYLFKNIEIHWKCNESLISNLSIPCFEVIKFPNGIKDYLSQNINESNLITKDYFCGDSVFDDYSKIEWAVAWHDDDGFIDSYCNTIETPLGGAHEQGFKSAILKALKTYGELTNNKKATQQNHYR
ncbi:MAG: DNA topoisomerase IV subunit B, partial [Rickettsiales bacterium]